MLRTRHSQKVMQGKRICSVPFSHMLLKLSNQTLQGTISSPMVRDRASINVHMAEARDFHCHSHVTDNRGEPMFESLISAEGTE